MSAVMLTDRQRQLHAAVTAAASHVSEQLLVIYPYANRLGAAETDVRAVRELLLAGHVRECSR